MQVALDVERLAQVDEQVDGVAEAAPLLHLACSAHTPYIHVRNLAGATTTTTHHCTQQALGSWKTYMCTFIA